jgi:hypothetical protein
LKISAGYMTDCQKAPTTHHAVFLRPGITQVHAQTSS